MPVHFYYEKSVRLNKRKELKRFIESIFTSESKKLANLNYIFCNDANLLKMNKQYLQHDYFTDIITFDLSESVSGPITGEVYISIDRVKDNARIHQVPVDQELHRVIFHGALHLCGYKDKTKAQQSEMRKKENQYLGNYGILR